MQSSRQRLAHLVALGICALVGITIVPAAMAELPRSRSCVEDAMLVFDGSGSMSGIDEYGNDRSSTRIDDARKALAQSLPHVAPYRRIGLISYGPGPVGRCDNVSLKLRPKLNAGQAIMAEVNNIEPEGRTPLTSAVAEAADALDYRNKAALIVLFTDGAETCDGQPCELGKFLKESGQSVTVHVIGYRMGNLISERAKGVSDMQCLAAMTGGRFIPVDAVDELIDAFNETLGCALMSKNNLSVPFALALESASKLSASGFDLPLRKLHVRPSH